LYVKHLMENISSSDAPPTAFGSHLPFVLLIVFICNRESPKLISFVDIFSFTFNNLLRRIRYSK